MTELVPLEVSRENNVKSPLRRAIHRWQYACHDFNSLRRCNRVGRGGDSGCQCQQTRCGRPCVSHTVLPLLRRSALCRTLPASLSLCTLWARRSPVARRRTVPVEPGPETSHNPSCAFEKSCTRRGFVSPLCQARASRRENPHHTDARVPVPDTQLPRLCLVHWIDGSHVTTCQWRSSLLMWCTKTCHRQYLL